MADAYITDSVYMQGYVDLAAAITKNAFNDYLSIRLDLFCFRYPNRGEHIRKRYAKIVEKVAKSEKLPASEFETRTKRTVDALKKRRDHLEARQRGLERFFDNGVCGTAFNFGDNVKFFRRLADEQIMEYVKNGEFTVKGGSI